MSAGSSGCAALRLGRRALANTLANWTGLAVGTLASLVLTPLLIDHLGMERFGIYQIARNFVKYLSLFSFGNLGPVIRFVAQGIAHDDASRVSVVANSALALFAVIALGGILISGLVALVAPGFFGVDPAYVVESRWLFITLGLCWALTMLAVPPRGLIAGHQRFGLISLVSSASWVLTVVAVVFLFELGYLSLTAVSFAFLLAGLLQLWGFTSCAHRVQRGLRWSARLVERATFRELYGFGMWNLLFTLSGLFLWASDNIIIGRLLGPAVVPYYAIPFMLIQYGRMITFGFSSQLMPLAAGQNVTQDRAGLQQSLLRGTRMALILTLASNGILVVVVEDVLRLWVGTAFAGGWVVYGYLMLSFWAVYAHLPSYHILVGAGRIRGPALGMLAASVVTLVLKILALDGFDIGIEGVALLNCVMLPVVLVYMPWCACRLVGIPLGHLYRKAYLGPLVTFVPVAGGGWLLTRPLTPLDPLELVLVLGGLVAIYGAFALWTLDGAERAAVLSLLRHPTSVFRSGRAARQRGHA